MKKCWVCEKDLEVIKDKPYHYKESGSDNVYLHGIIQYKCSGCGEEAPEIMTQGETLEELEENMKDAYAMMTLGDVPTQHEIKELVINI